MEVAYGILSDTAHVLVPWSGLLPSLVLSPFWAMSGSSKTQAKWKLALLCHLQADLQHAPEVKRTEVFWIWQWGAYSTDQGPSRRTVSHQPPSF